MSNKTIYELNLHEAINESDGSLIITRVPGGWMYETSTAEAYVPYNNEFQVAGNTKN